jgi:uncharacterized protein YeaO (DUF488 family)
MVVGFVPMVFSRGMNGIAVKRVYEPASRMDGTRILVDRLWPRGLRKEDAAIDRWMKDLAPSAELRQWFGHKPERWSEFRERYRAEIVQHGEALTELLLLVEKRPVTLLYAAQDNEHNNAVVLQEVLVRRRRLLPRRARPSALTR